MSIFYLFIFALLLIFPAESISKEIPFLFSVDQNIKNEVLTNTIKPSKDITKSEWFNSPLTRLELITYALYQYFMENHKENEDRYLRTADSYFEKKAKSGMSFRPDLQFFKEKGVFMASTTIRFPGKPKKPIKDFCDKILGSLDEMFSGAGYFLQNNILAPFIFSSFDDPEVLKIVNLLRNNFVVMVQVECAYSEEKNKSSETLYYFRAYKYTKDDKIHYEKDSVKWTQ